MAWHGYAVDKPLIHCEGAVRIRQTGAQDAQAFFRAQCWPRRQIDRRYPVYTDRLADRSRPKRTGRDRPRGDRRRLLPILFIAVNVRARIGEALWLAIAQSLLLRIRIAVLGVVAPLEG
jgi:hypothetical protein